MRAAPASAWHPGRGATWHPWPGQAEWKALQVSVVGLCPWLMQLHTSIACLDSKVDSDDVRGPPCPPFLFGCWNPFTSSTISPSTPSHQDRVQTIAPSSSFIRGKRATRTNAILGKMLLTNGMPHNPTTFFMNSLICSGNSQPASSRNRAPTSSDPFLGCARRPELSHLDLLGLPSRCQGPIWKSLVAERYLIA